MTTIKINQDPGRFSQVCQLWGATFHGNCLFPSDVALAVILNSHQTREPIGSDPWIQSSAQCLEELSRQGKGVISSLGLNTWEMVSWYAGQLEIPLLLLVHLPQKIDPETFYIQVLLNFGLLPEKTWMIAVPYHSQLDDLDRDRKILALADHYYPIHLRPNGKLRNLLHQSDQTRIDHRYEIHHHPFITRKPSYIFDQTAIRTRVDDQYRNCLIHWTRACHGPWPGERAESYYQSLFTSRERYCHSARATLSHICEEQRIRASTWKIRGQVPMICFTSLSPSDSTYLMCWRKRYVRYTVEPYGISINRTIADNMGVIPVQYQNDCDRLHIANENPFVQSSGLVADWRMENEYRHRGDLYLQYLPEGSWQTIDLSGCEAT
jgi:hypothetical protein